MTSRLAKKCRNIVKIIFIIIARGDVSVVYVPFEIPAKYSVQKFSGMHISYTLYH